MKTAAIFFDIRKCITKSTKKRHLKTRKQGNTWKNYGVIRELIGERWIKFRVGGSISQSKQTVLGIPQGGVLRVILFLVAINGILGELGNRVDGPLFADDLSI